MDYGRRGLVRKQKSLNSRRRKRANKVGLIAGMVLFLLVVGVCAMAACVGFGAFRGIIDSAPDISNIDVTPTGYSTFVYDSQGNQTAKLVSTDSNRIPVTLDMVPKDLQHAFVAIEDERFYQHPGIDMQGILRAMVIGVTSGHFSEGASTITQQLIKNNVFTGWTDESFSESVRRKIQEWYLAVELEKTMSKDDILLNYMNTINLGHSTLGVEAASRRYFGKSVSKLNLSECAVIAGITQNPSYYDPIIYPEHNKERRAQVLKNMRDQGWISQDEYDNVLQDDVYSRIQVVDNNTNDNAVNSYFVDALTDEILADLMKKGYSETQAYTLLYSGGLNIYSTQDPKIQSIVDEVVNDEANYPNGTRWYLQYQLTVQSSDGTVTNYSTEMMESHFRQSNPYFTLIFNTKEDAKACEEEYKNAVVGPGDTVLGERDNITAQPQVSLTLEDQHTGNILAISGGRGEKKANRTLNRATDTVRQPGSTFKVVSTYAPALDAGGLTLATTQNDAPYAYADGTPVRNWYGEAYRGLSSLRLGIQNSMNIVAVKTLVDITPQLGYEYLLDFGFTTLVDNEEINGRVFSDIQPTLALGGITKGVKNIELNASYATIANGGEYLEPKMYTKVTDHDGNVILDANEIRQTRRVLKETTAWLLTSAMEDVVTKGTGTRVNFGTTPIAGKTGTTSDENDVWFSGYTNYYCCTTWAGYDENTDLVGSESGIAKTIWRGVMEKVHENLPSSDFQKPAGIVQMTVCRLSGKLPVAGLCDGSLTTEYFDQDNVPTEQCDIHYQGTICAYSGLPATDECPFKTTGVATFDESGLKCIHTAEFMAQPNIADILAQEQAEMDQAASAAAASDAQSVLNSANAALQEASNVLQTAQDNLVAAQQSGDANAIAAAQETVNTAANNYNVAVQQQAAAQQALAAAQASGQTQTGAAGTATGAAGAAGTATGAATGAASAPAAAPAG